MILNPGQEKIKAEAIDWYRNSSEQVFEIEGAAGTGKSVLIYEILKALGLKSFQYMPMAYTGQASIVMRSKGFTTARSIHSSLYEVVDVYDNENMNTQFGLPSKHKEFRLRQYIDPMVDLFFIDEAYMVPDYMVKDIKSFGKKIIVCGDSHQLPPIGGKPGFLTGYGVHRLTQLMRQAENDPIVYLAMRAMQGLPIHEGMYGNNVLVINDDEFVPQMIGFANAIVCGTNRTKDTLNKYVRQVAGFNSDLPRFGERVICKNNNWQCVQDGIALANGLCGTVVSQPDASSYNGKTFDIHFKPDLANTVFYNVPVNYEYFTGDYETRQDMKSMHGRKYSVGELFEYAYALTTHVSQGSEYNNMIYIEEFMRPQIQNQLNYTGITRAKHGLIYMKKRNKYIYTPNLKDVI